MNTFKPRHLRILENEAIHVIRESIAQFERPVILFSGGKDSIVLTWIARKACFPAPVALPLLHIDTGHNFPETLAFRDEFAAALACRCVIRTVQATIDAGRATDETGPNASRNALQSVTLLDAVTELGIDAAIGGARRDEEKARAKERFFSHRDSFGHWDPKNQRPEVWNIYNGLHHPGEHVRVFPLSNWTERDVWEYIAVEEIPLPGLYFAKRRPVVDRRGVLMAESPFVSLLPGEQWQERSVRFRTIDDATCTGAMASTATTVSEILDELARLRVTERGGRFDDRRSDTAMEDRKRQGYF